MNMVLLIGSIILGQAGDAQVAEGEKVYAAKRCGSCHSIAGKGNKRSPLDGVGGKLTEAQLRKWLVAPREMNPKVRKPSYEKLPPGELDALVAYLQSLK